MRQTLYNLFSASKITIIPICTKKTGVFLAKKGLKIKGSRVQEVQEFKMADIRCALKLMIGCYFKYLVVSVFLLTIVSAKLNCI